MSNKVDSKSNKYDRIYAGAFGVLLFLIIVTVVLVGIKFGIPEFFANIPQLNMVLLALIVTTIILALIIFIAGIYGLIVSLFRKSRNKDTKNNKTKQSNNKINEQNYNNLRQPVNNNNSDDKQEFEDYEESQDENHQITVQSPINSKVHMVEYRTGDTLHIGIKEKVRLVNDNNNVNN